MTEWKTVKDFPEYQVSSDGEIKKHTRTIKPYDNGTGYLQVKLIKEGKQYAKYVHVLVAEAFIEKPIGCEVNHINRNRKDCRLDNLEWLTHKDNIRYSRRLGSWGSSETKKSFTTV